MKIEDTSTWALRNVVLAANEPALRDALAAAHIETWVLEGDGVRDAQGLVARAHRNLLPAAAAPADWPALADRLWERLVQARASELAIVWRNSDQLLRARLEDFLAAVDALQRLARKAYAPGDATRPKTLYLFLVGSGPGYA